MIEIFIDIKGYEGLYQISNLGRVKSLSKLVNNRYGKLSLKKEKILNPTLSNGYPHLHLCKEGKSKTFLVHKLMASNFLNHNEKGNKLVVNHINFIRDDNRLENLEIITNRENTNLKHIESTSKFTGVSWNKLANKWTSYIRINGVKNHLGYFTDEAQASNAYNLKLSTL